MRLFCCAGILLGLNISCVMSGFTLWPGGTYGLPKALSGCPSSQTFRWQTGWRFQDSEGVFSDNAKSAEFHLDGWVSFTGVNRSFCIKPGGDVNTTGWQKGKYCIYKKGACPQGMSQGHVKWDDDDNFLHLSDKGGVLPDGVFGYDTKLYFCCRTDGNKTEPVSLPTDQPFFLLAYGSPQCQQVKWALATSEWIHFDVQDSLGINDQGGTYPYGAGINGHTIHYCHYQSCNQTLYGTKGTFQSPNYPRKYPDGQLCSWRITGIAGQRIRLRFINFTLQKDNNTDSVRVFDGWNESSPSLGEFYGGHVPPGEGLTSSSDVMFVIFTSDAAFSYAGFQASFESIALPEMTTSAVTKSSSNVTPSGSETTFRSTSETTSPSTVTQSSTNITPSRSESTTAVTSGEDNDRARAAGKGKRTAFDYVAVVLSVLGVVGIALLFLALVFWRRKRQRKMSNQTKEASILQGSDDRASYIYSTVEGGTAIYDNKCMHMENVLYSTAGEDEKLMANKFSENVLYWSVDNEITFFSSESKAEATTDKESSNPLYESFEVSDN